jgi:hypothetical protein
MTVVTIFSMPCLVSPDANFCGRAFITAATGKVNRIDARTWPGAKREFSKDWNGGGAFFPRIGKSDRISFQALEKSAAVFPSLGNPAPAPPEIRRPTAPNRPKTSAAPPPRRYYFS